MAPGSPEVGKRLRKPMDNESDSDSGSERNTIKFETLRDEGDHFLHVSLFQKAIESYTKALGLSPKDTDTLVSRSKCHLQLGNAKEALRDAEAALSEDKDFHKGLFQKAEALYLIGDFETALVFYHRGNKLRPEKQEFRLGIQKSQEAINNSIGSPESVKLENKGDLSFFFQKDERNKPKGRPQRPEEAERRKQEAKQRQRARSQKDAKTVKQLLGELYADKEFLERLLVDEAFTRQTKTNMTIRQLAEDGLDYLDTRTDFWLQQKPIYARKRDKLLRDGKVGKGKQSNPTKYILNNLEKIDEAQNKGKHEESLKLSKKLLKSLDHMSDSDVKNKPDILANIHSCTGNAYLELNQYPQALEHHQKDYDLAEEHELPEAKSRAMDNLGRVYARMGEFQKAIDIWEQKLPLSSSPLESTWLNHEVGRCLLELGKNKEAKDYGEKSLADAKECDDGIWQLNASVLIAQSEAKLGDYQAALNAFERSHDLARQQGDRAAEVAIEKAIEEINEKVLKAVDSSDRGSVRSASAERKSVKDGHSSDEDDSKSQKSAKSETKSKTSEKGDTSPRSEKGQKEKEEEDNQSEQGEKEPDKAEDKPEPTADAEADNQTDKPATEESSLEPQTKVTEQTKEE
ncbi:tetratricopeptide repeat protein 25 isoform X2 [Lingula anatina]|uniref:Outer dynein arm-docking complex subunit 4 n=1 Tax=Lingula anatina TaxID=7574 RepID=A0A1S3KFH0_LINAN|nr:tetratricopeptide repeat protein 25 isoform X2 [Lingula anatina]|eukprot:XP_013421204.1 tetratricopeptide repeat protein 25 isoform X2 [Lingula anatina]